MSKTNSQFKQTAWDLSDVIAAPDGKPLQNLIEELEAIVSAIEAMRPKLSEDISAFHFKRTLELSQQLTAAATRLGSYAGLWFSENTQNQAALAFQGKIEQLTTEAQNRALFLPLWWKTLAEAPAARLIVSAPVDLQYYLKQQRKARTHVLAERDEQIINIKDINGGNALTTIYAMLTNKYKFQLHVDG